MGRSFRFSVLAMVAAAAVTYSVCKEEEPWPVGYPDTETVRQ